MEKKYFIIFVFEKNKKMILIPAIDIKNNNCIRLLKGNIKKKTLFKKNTILVVDSWINFGIKRLHIVDLDGAFQGRPKNLLTIKSIIKYVPESLQIQIGGGIRSMETIDYYFDIGVKKIILGTKAVTDISFFEKACDKYKEKILLSLDLKNLKIAIDGWKNYYDCDLFDYLEKIKNYSFESIIYTDIEKDGTLEGIDIKKIIKISECIEKPIIISGGLSNYEDIKNLFDFQNGKLFGLICGKSIYSGNLDFESINNKIKIFNKIILNNI